MAQMEFQSWLVDVFVVVGDGVEEFLYVYGMYIPSATFVSIGGG